MSLVNVPRSFDPETDPDRPKVGDLLDDVYRIEKVSWFTSSDLMADMMRGEPVDKQGFDEVLSAPHSTRPFVWWQVFVTKL